MERAVMREMGGAESEFALSRMGRGNHYPKVII